MNKTLRDFIEEKLAGKKINENITITAGDNSDICFLCEKKIKNPEIVRYEPDGNVWIPGVDSHVSFCKSCYEGPLRKYRTFLFGRN
ncbi:MAG: hypothetical protein ACTSWN_07670 [Promethearchaeota archaeon]